jgi:hypothetical protein
MPRASEASILLTSTQLYVLTELELHFISRSLPQTTVDGAVLSLSGGTSLGTGFVWRVFIFMAKASFDLAFFCLRLP